jgi:hypothetical protein
MKSHLLVLALALTTITSGFALSRGYRAGPTHHSGQIDTNEVWYPSGNPHILDGDVCTGNNVTLTIAPACTVKAEYGVELYTGYARPGAIVAVGTADSVIVFTSNIAGPQPGDWTGVGIYDLARNTTRFSHCDFSYAGGTSSRGTFYVSGVAVGFDHCRISQSGDYGVEAGRDGRFSPFINNTIATCASYPVLVWAGYASTLGTGNVLTGNTYDGVLVRGGNVSISGTWLNHGVPYVITGDVSIQDATNNPVLTIAAGTKLMLRPMTEFYVGYAAPGGLIADGAAGQIEFTSSVTPPSPGDWVGVSFYDQSISSMCRLINCKVEYGGSDGYGNIQISNCTPEVTDDSIGHSSAWGIYVRGSEYPDPDSLFADNTFYDCASGAVNKHQVGIANERLGPCSTIEPATVVRGVLNMQVGSRQYPAYRAELLDITGRKVMDLHAGANDLLALAPGVYFVREEPQASSLGPQAVQKVIIAR